MNQLIEVKLWCSKPGKPASYINPKIFEHPFISLQGLKLYGILFIAAKSEPGIKYSLCSSAGLSPDEYQKEIAVLVTQDLLFVDGSTYYLGDGAKRKASKVAESYGVSMDKT